MTRLLRRIVSPAESPERLALSFSIGTALSFSPPYGFHTLLGLAIAYAFGLNRAAMLVGIYINNPWTIVPYYAFATWVGMQITGIPEGVAMPHVGLRELFTRAFWGEIVGQWKILIPATVGSLVLALIIGIVCYPIMVRLIRHYQAQWWEQAPG